MKTLFTSRQAWHFWAAFLGGLCSALAAVKGHPDGYVWIIGSLFGAKLGFLALISFNSDPTKQASTAKATPEQEPIK
jgi:hypothetical protein